MSTYPSTPEDRLKEAIRDGLEKLNVDVAGPWSNPTWRSRGDLGTDLAPLVLPVVTRILAEGYAALRQRLKVELDWASQYGPDYEPATARRALAEQLIDYLDEIGVVSA